jgi:hypothetical protein
MTRSEEESQMASGLREISREELIELAQRAAERKLEFDVVAVAGMTMERATRIRDLRKTRSWRAIAGATHKEWGPDAMWEPETNQLAGMALCEAAAAMLGEDPERLPWQSRQ